MDAETRSEITRASWERMRAGEGYIYAARLDDGVIKIGFALDPAKRVRELKGVIIATIPGTREQEMALHKALVPFMIPNYGGRPLASEFYVPAVLTHAPIPETMRAGVRSHPLRRKRPGGQRKAKRDAEVIALHDGGRRTLQEVGDQLGLTRERVRQILKKNNVDIRRGIDHVSLDICRERIERYRKALTPGTTTKEAHDICGVTPTELRLAARRLGVKLPKSVRRERLRYHEIAAYYEANPALTGVDVARHFHVAPNTISKALRIAEVISRQAGWKHKRAERFAQQGAAA